MEKGGERQTRATWIVAETNRRDDGMVGQLFHKFEVKSRNRLERQLVSFTMAKFVFYSV